MALYAWVGLVCSVLLLRALIRHLVPQHSAVGPSGVRGRPGTDQHVAVPPAPSDAIRGGDRLRVLLRDGRPMADGDRGAGPGAPTVADDRRQPVLRSGHRRPAHVGRRWGRSRRGGPVGTEASQRHLSRSRHQRDVQAPDVCTRAVRLCVLLLAWYNHVRFGGFANFGERYELAGIEQTKVRSTASPTSRRACSHICCFRRATR